MTDQFVNRAIDVKLTLGQGDFGADAPSGSNVATFSGLRVSANISFVGSPGVSMANIRVWGLSESIMNTFSSLGRPILYDRTNTVTLSAGDNVNGIAQVYNGIIQDAYQVFDDSGAASLDITSQPTLVDKTKPIAPSSYPNGADAAVVLSGLANQMGLGFANYGVQVQLSPGSYFWGTAAAQAEQVRKAANILMHNDGTTLTIWPQGGTSTGQIPLIGPDSGLVGYPTLSSYGVKIKTLFNPQIVLTTQIQLQTSLLRAVGLWYPMSISHELESITPGGAWFTMIDCARNTDNTP